MKIEHVWFVEMIGDGFPESYELMSIHLSEDSAQLHCKQLNEQKHVRSYTVSQQDVMYCSEETT